MLLCNIVIQSVLKEPVSYTHLDVYKRQVFAFLTFCIEVFRSLHFSSFGNSIDFFAHLLLSIRHTRPYYFNHFESVVSFILAHIFIFSLTSSFLTPYQSPLQSKFFLLSFFLIPTTLARYFYFTDCIMILFLSVNTKTDFQFMSNTYIFVCVSVSCLFTNILFII